MENKQNLPSGWRWVKLGEVIKFTQSGTWGEEPFEAPQEEIYRVIRSTEINHKGEIIINDNKVANRRVKPETAKKYFLKPNDLLIVRSGGTNGKIILGRVGIYLGEPDKYIFSNFLLKAKADDSLVLPEFLWRYLNWEKFLQDNIPNLMRRTTGIQNLPVDDYFSIQIPLPPLSEQKRIAAKLKGMMNEVNDARTACEKQLEAAKALPSAYLREVFESPEACNWPQKRLGEVCEIIKGKKPNTSLERISDEALPYLTTDVIRYNLEPNWCLTSNGDVVPVNKNEIIIIADGSNSGEVFIGYEGALASTMGKLKIDVEKVDTDYLYFFIKMNFEELNVPKRGSAIPHLEKNIFYNLRIPLPPLTEQKRIAEHLKEKITQAEKLQTAIEKELATINSLPQSILNKAFKGEL